MQSSRGRSTHVQIATTRRAKDPLGERGAQTMSCLWIMEQQQKKRGVTFPLRPAVSGPPAGQNAPHAWTCKQADS